MKVQILSYIKFGKEEVLGTVSLDALGHIVYGGDIPPAVVDTIETWYTLAPNPQAFLDGLPRQFQGAYIRAVKVGSVH